MKSGRSKAASDLAARPNLGASYSNLASWPVACFDEFASGDYNELHNQLRQTRISSNGFVDAAYPVCI